MSTMGAIWRQLLGIAISGVSIFWADCTQAQSKIIPDNTLGAERSNVIRNFNGLPVEVINGGAIRGQNLFHSFLEFNVSQGRGAYFYSPSSAIQNIVTRVTGSNPSEILGVLGTFGNSNPNLFLINPNGIIFGPNASLNVGGSFLATTANAIQFGNQGIFSATNPEAPSPLLTINPSALLINQIVAGTSIQNSSTFPAGLAPSGSNASGLRVPDGKSLVLVGGNISMDGGQLNAYGGRVELGGLAASGSVGLNVDGDQLSLDFPAGSTRADISLTNGASVYTGNGGNITLYSNSLSLANGSNLDIITYGQVNAGNIIINATKSVSLDGSFTSINNDVGTIYSGPEDAIKGNGGNIQITTPQLSLTNSAELSASTFGQGNAGNVIINATKSVSLDNARVFTNVGNVYDSPEQRNAFKGNGGNIQITTPQLSLINNAQLQTGTFGQGNAGNVIINATKSVSLDGSYTDSKGQIFSSAIFSSVGDVYDSPEQRNAIKGNGGNIQITTPQLSLTNVAEIVTSSEAQGNAGNVIINATKSVSLDGSSDISSNVGDVKDTPEQRNAIKGNGGNIQITTSQLYLTNGASLEADTFAQGNAGTIKVNAAANVTISGKSSNIKSGLYVNSQSPTGTAGDIIVTSPKVTLDNSGKLDAESILGNGGNINLQSDLLLLRRGAQISTNAGTAEAGGNGGNITINTPNGFIVSIPNENSDITANAFNGSGGVIKITALSIYNFNQRSLSDLENFLGTKDPTKLNPQLLQTNDITAISLTSPALSGQINLITPDIDPSRGLVTLPTVTENASKPISSTCAAFDEKSGGSNFTVTGRSGLPPSPDEPLTSDVVWSDTRLPVTTAQHQRKTHAAKPKPQPIAIVPATGWVFNDKGEVTLISSVSNPTSLNAPTNCPAE